jgi:hypothetical protein
MVYIHKFQFENRWTDFYEIWYGRFAIGGKLTLLGEISDSGGRDYKDCSALGYTAGRKQFGIVATLGFWGCLLLLPGFDVASAYLG